MSATRTVAVLNYSCTVWPSARILDGNEKKADLVTESLPYRRHFCRAYISVNCREGTTTTGADQQLESEAKRSYFLAAAI